MAFFQKIAKNHYLDRIDEFYGVIVSNVGIFFLANISILIPFIVFSPWLPATLSTHFPPHVEYFLTFDYLLHPYNLSLCESHCLHQPLESFCHTAG